MSMDPRVFASQGQLGLHLIALLKDQRQPDRLRAAKPLVRKLLQTKQPIPPDLPQLLLNALEKSLRSGKTSFELSMDNFLSCLGVLIEETGPRLSDLAYRLFYQILLLPLETKDRKQIINDKIYFQLYDSVRMDKNDEAERRFLVLIKLILDMVVDTNLSDPSKLFNLVRKAGEKYQNSQIVNVIFSFYVARIQAALLGQEQNAAVIKALSEMSKIITIKYRVQTAQVMNKAILVIVDGNGGSLLPGFCVYLLIEGSKKQVTNIYTLMLSDQKLCGGRLAARLRETSQKMGDVLVEVGCFQLPIADKRPKIRLEQLLMVLLAGLLAKSYEHPDNLEEFFRRAAIFCRQGNTNLEDVIASIVLMVYLQSIEFTCGRDIEINKLNMSPINYVLIYFFKKRNQGSLLNFLSSLVLNKIQFNVTIDQLGLLSQHRFIIETLTKTDSIIDSKILYGLIETFNQNTSYELCDKTKLLLYKTLCRLDKVEEMITNFKNERLGRRALQAQPQTNIFRLQKSVLDCYFATNLDLESTVKFLLSISVGDILMSSLIDLLFQRIMSIDQVVTTTVKKKQSFLDISYRLMQEIDFTVLQNLGQTVTTQHPWIEKSLKLITSLKPSVLAMKRIIGLRFDRPSEYTIRKDLIPNRFLLKCIQLGDMKNLMKNILDVVSKVEDPDFYLRNIFDDMPKEVRARYMKYLTTKNIAEFRVFLLDYPQYMHLAE